METQIGSLRRKRTGRAMTRIVLSPESRVSGRKPIFMCLSGPCPDTRFVELFDQDGYVRIPNSQLRFDLVGSGDPTPTKVTSQR